MRLSPSTFLRTALIAAALVLPSALHAEPTAADILARARTTAVAQHKNILLIFSASWCGPCHMFQHFLADPAIAPIMNKAYVITTLDAEEQATDTRHHDTPGATDLLAKLGGGVTVGIPYLVMLTPTGHPIVNSLRPDPKAPAGGNIGYPSTPAEVDWFMLMLQKSAPTLTPQETATLHAWLTAHGS